MSPAVPERDHDRRRLALGLTAASGFAGLGFEIVWTHQSALWLGHEAAAVLAVVAAFFGGLALGAFVLGHRIARSARPALAYAACEAAIGAWGLALAFLMAPATSVLLELIGAEPSAARHWLMAFGGVFVLLLPATAAMGATLPAMERVLATLRARGEPIASLYAANTFGALLGVLGAAFVLVPGLGLLATAALCAALNFACAAAATRLARNPRADAATGDGTLAYEGEIDAPTRRAATAAAAALAAGAAAPRDRRDAPRPRAALLVLTATGFLGIGYEVLVVRALCQVAEDTVYTFAILLAVYLVGTALGAATYARSAARRTRAANDAQRIGDGLLRALAAACLLGYGALACSGTVKAAVLGALGGSMPAALAAEAALGAAAFLLPTIVMGALFSHLAAYASTAGAGIGRALGANTLGAAAAPSAFGVLLVPRVGTSLALLLIAAGYLALVSRRAWAAPAQWLAAGAAAALAAWAPSLMSVDVPDGGRLVRQIEGVLATVSIVEDGDGVARLHIDNRQQEGSSATRLADARQALVPILLHPAPRRALFLGLGTGVTAASAAADPELRVDAVELLPEVIEASAYFTAAVFGQGTLPTAAPGSRLRFVAADARRYVRASRERYDVIVADNFHPARSGSGSLYTVEHFAAVRERLTADGVFCQWLPLHQLDLDTLRSIVRTFVAVYPHAAALLATNSLDTPVVGLVARADGRGFVVNDLRARLAGARLPLAPAALGVPDELALLGNFVAGPGALARFAGDAPLNTDDRPVVAYRAPRITYAPDSLPRDRLVALLHAVDLTPDELLDTPRDAAWDARLAAYWTARDRFIEAGRAVRPTSDVRQMLAQVREPLLSVLRVSPDFRPAYDPLLRMAADLGRVDTAAARALLLDLGDAQPARPEAAEALRELPAAAR
jgi:spermidine synthase